MPIALVTARAALGTSALPPEFDFSEQELVAAIRGTWTDVAAGVVVTLEPREEAEITYIRAGSGGWCGPSAYLPVEGDVTVGAAATAVTGGFSVVGTEIFRGSLELDGGQYLCGFEYYLVDGSPVLDGACDFMPLGLDQVALVMTRATQR